jgi:hypothetical protein
MRGAALLVTSNSKTFSLEGDVLLIQEVYDSIRCLGSHRVSVRSDLAAPPPGPPHEKKELVK